MVDAHDFVGTILNENGGQSDCNSRQQQRNNTLVIVIPNPGYESPTNEGKNKDDTRLYVNHPAVNDYLTVQNETGSFKFNKNRRISAYGETTTLSPRDHTKKRIKKQRVYAPKQEDNNDHERRLREIKEHMEQHFTSTLYLYNEAKRIERTNVVMDELRLMAEDIATPRYETLKQKILDCGRLPEVKKHKDIWKKPNNVIIDIQKDPINDNVPS